MMVLKQTAVLLLISAFELGFINAFQSGYTYIESTKAFYKYHTKETLWLDAKTTCQTEEAVLFHPESKYELDQVLSALAVKIENEWINIGISDFAKTNSYVTTDGRPISQVYSKWFPFATCFRNPNCHCGYLNIKSQELVMDSCKNTKGYICKRQAIEEIVRISIEKINTDIANTSFVTSQLLANQSETIEVLEKEAESMKLQASNQSAAIDVLEREAVSMKLQAANQSETIEVLEREAASMKLQVANNSATIDFMRRELEGMKKAHAENQKSVLERIAEANANQATALERIAEADTNLAKAAQQQLEAALERQSLALEKIANLLDTNDQLGERSQQ